jgi:hypothetical protein
MLIEMKPSCRVCGNAEGNITYEAREMMFGSRERFVYSECDVCGALQLVDVPDDLSRFYPTGYYSFEPETWHGDRRWVSSAKRARTEILLKLPRRTVARLVSRRRIPGEFAWFAGLDLSSRSSICDIGSGGGAILLALARLGFRSLTGIDPFLPEEKDLPAGVRLRRATARDIEDHYRVFTLHHSFEHMSDQLDVLCHLRAHLQPGGAIVIRTPIADCFAWRKYRIDWVGLDAPRHLLIPTRQAMDVLAEGAGLRVTRTFFDSYALQFWGSEQYQRDIPLHDPCSWIENPEGSLFTAEQVAEWERQSRELNDLGQGDSAGFVLRAD